MVVTQNYKPVKPQNYFWQHKTKNGENVPIFEVPKVFSVQCNLADNHNQQKSDALYTFTPNKFYAYILNFKPGPIMFLKTNYTEFYIIKILTKYWILPQKQDQMLQ